MDNTRDIVIDLKARFEAFEKRAGPILEDLHADHVRRKERGALVTAAIALAKSVPAGAVGAAALWIINHAPFAPR